jgi:hypothetical protein
MAAGNLPGERTIHNLFSFSFKDLKSSTNLPALSIQAINDLKLRLKPDEIIMIVINEVSYISPEFIDKRLQQLTGKKGVPYIYMYSIWRY